MRAARQLIQLFISVILCGGAVPGFAQQWVVGMSSGRTPILAEGYPVDGGRRPTVVLIGGITGDPATGEKMRAQFEDYKRRGPDNQPVNLILIANANPEGETLVFPPEGRAYADDPVSWSLWRWLGIHGPDLVLIEGETDYNLADALSNRIVAGVGYVPGLHLYDEPEELEKVMAELGNLPYSAAREMLDRRLDRSPLEFASQLAAVYGHDFSWPVYINGMALIGRMRLGYLDDVDQVLSPYLDGEPININSSLVTAGHLAFAEQAERAGRDDYLALAKRAADLGFDADGGLRQVMPMHGEMSDAYFMDTPLLAKMGKLTGDHRYFELARRHIRSMEAHVLRDDGLYRHSPLTDAAWSRGNAFPALGLALALSDFDTGHPGYAELLDRYRALMAELVPYQDIDGMWHVVIDEPASYAELSATAMIATAMKRGIDRGWIDDGYSAVVEKAWQAVLLHSSPQGYFLNVCESTNKQPDLDAYLDREALSGRDDRAGGMLLMFAAEMAGLP